jgi:hypothetical protein
MVLTDPISLDEYVKSLKSWGYPRPRAIPRTLDIYESKSGLGRGYAALQQ